MEFDFSKPAPKARSLNEAQQIIQALWNSAIEFQTIQQTLASKIADLEERLKPISLQT